MQTCTSKRWNAVTSRMTERDTPTLEGVSPPAMNQVFLTWEA